MNNSDAKLEMDKIRAEAKQLLREIEAICTLVKLADHKAHLAKLKESLAAWDETALRAFLEAAKQDIEGLRNYYGIKALNREIVELVDRAENSSGNLVPLLPKHVWREMFDHYERVMPDFADLPEHTDIAVNISHEAGPGKTELYILEAILYEDMACMFNLTKEHQLALDQEKGSLKAHKTLKALCRGTVASAFYFLESYLNGIAFDHYVTHESALDQKAREVLLEWDYKGNRARHLSIRDKALQYPRIILGLGAPPLNESNCPELDFITKNAKMLRDAIVHAAPRKYDPSLTDKRQALYGIGVNEVEATVDNVVRLVRRIETLVRGNQRRLWWLYDRSSDGCFRDATFD
jgi:hypothetical protein